MTEKDNSLPCDALTQGYILLPKSLLNDSFAMTKKEFSHLEAFLMILTKVNFKDSVANIRGSKIICKRGETLISLRKWEKIFGWKKHKTRYFFEKMREANLIRIIPTNTTNIHIIQIVDYDLWTSKPREDWEKRKTKSEELFEVFWNQYHEITQTPKREIGAARKAWNKLTGSERNAAVKSIYAYYMSLENTNYIKRACNYLSDKSFLNDDIY